MSRRLIAAAAVLSLVVSVLVAGAFPAVSADREPSLRVLGGARELTVTRFPDEELSIVPGTYLAAVGGPLEIRVRRTADGLVATQVLPTADGGRRTVRRLPDWAVQDLSAGLHAFFVVTLRDADGEVVSRRRAPLCVTGSFDSARVDDTGPQTPQYPPGCYTSALAKTAVWGIDKGWAVRAPQFVGSQGNFPDGRYEVTVAVAPRWVRLFAIEERFAAFTANVTVETSEPPPCEEPDGSACPAPCEGGEGGVPLEPCPEPEPEPAEPGPAVAGGELSAEHDHVLAATPEVRGDAGGLPDLAALPAHAISVRTDQETLRDVITFGATVWNRGPGPLVVEGFRRPGRDLMDARQYFFEGGRRVDTHDAGTLEFDARDGHHHWHFTDFARYRLLDADKGFVRRSRKEAFCLAPTDAIDMTLPTANWQPGSTGLETACGGPESIWIREILDVGWGDTYHQSLPGQSFDVTNLDNGTYFIEVATNPVSNLRERTRTNNVAYTKIRLSGSQGERVVECLSPGRCG